jgi:hypothetical protein
MAALPGSVSLINANSLMPTIRAVPGTDKYNKAIADGYTLKPTAAMIANGTAPAPVVNGNATTTTTNAPATPAASVVLSPPESTVKAVSVSGVDCTLTVYGARGQGSLITYSALLSGTLDTIPKGFRTIAPGLHVFDGLPSVPARNVASKALLAACEEALKVSLRSQEEIDAELDAQAAKEMAAIQARFAALKANEAARRAAFVQTPPAIVAPEAPAAPAPVTEAPTVNVD